MRIQISAILLVVLISCDNNAEKATVGKDTVIQQPAPSEHTSEKKPSKFNEDVGGCYMQILKRDTMVLTLRETGDELTGKLTYDNYQKDGSSGMVRGRRDGDVFKLLYTFESEGMKSVMDVYFKRQGGGIVRGIGDMQTKDDTAYFTKPDKVQYRSTGIFEKVDCNIVPAKYK